MKSKGKETSWEALKSYNILIMLGEEYKLRNRSFYNNLQLPITLCLEKDKAKVFSVSSLVVTTRCL
jgi:hypothetical protein